MKFPIFRYKLNEHLHLWDIFNSDLFGEKHDVSVYILSPALHNYQTKYPYDWNIGNILEANKTQRNFGKKNLEYPVHLISNNIKIRLSDCDKHILYIRIKLNIEDYECICNLIYYYTFRYFSNKMNNIHLYDMDLLPMDKCDVSNLCIVHISNWMKYMDIPV